MQFLAAAVRRRSDFPPGRREEPFLAVASVMVGTLRGLFP
jgi:hypothetical protein